MCPAGYFAWSFSDHCINTGVFVISLLVGLAALALFSIFCAPAIFRWLRGLITGAPSAGRFYEVTAKNVSAIVAETVASNCRVYRLSRAGWHWDWQPKKYNAGVVQRLLKGATVVVLRHTDRAALCRVAGTPSVEYQPEAGLLVWIGMSQLRYRCRQVGVVGDSLLLQEVKVDEHVARQMAE